MKRILILGCCGAGKSTLARKITTHLNIPIIHLDQEYWKPNWEETNKEDWNKKVENLITRESWIMDGNYGGTLDIRILRADTIIYLDRSTFTCMNRVLKRIRKYKGTTRPDMTEGCPERYDWDFLHYVLSFNIARAPKLKRKIKALQNEKKIYILKSEKQITSFLASLTK